MSALTIEGRCKLNGAEKSEPIGEIHFYVDGPLRLRLEEAEERLQKTHEPEAMVDVDMDTLDLILPEGYGPLSDCQMRGPCSNSVCSGHELYFQRTLPRRKVVLDQPVLASDES